MLLVYFFVKKREFSLRHYLKKLSEQEFLSPDGLRKKPGLTTLRRKLSQYREGGFDALARKRRSDCGKSRSVSQEIMGKAV